MPKKVARVSLHARTALVVAVLAFGCSNGSPPDPPGEEPILDEAWTDCYEGDMSACDLLILGAQIGSDYHDVGLTCGERRDPSTVTCDPQDLDLTN